MHFIAQLHYILAIKITILQYFIFFTRSRRNWHSRRLWKNWPIFMLAWVNRTRHFKVAYNRIRALNKIQHVGIYPIHRKIAGIKINSVWLWTVTLYEWLIVIQSIPRAVIDFSKFAFGRILDTFEKLILIAVSLLPENAICNLGGFNQVGNAFAFSNRQQSGICF